LVKITLSRQSRTVVSESNGREVQLRGLIPLRELHMLQSFLPVYLVQAKGIVPISVLMGQSL